MNNKNSYYINVAWFEQNLNYNCNIYQNIYLFSTENLKLVNIHRVFLHKK